MEWESPEGDQLTPREKDVGIDLVTTNWPNCSVELGEPAKYKLGERSLTVSSSRFERKDLEGRDSGKAAGDPIESIS